ncbi:hypothetical protein ACLPJF_17115 [Pseudomonas vlassakiae]|uniref:hypothetical protein n=1 Tax=Pseudomonas vlassakiae TaxID=485888 RepID=UPI003FD8D0CA
MLVKLPAETELDILVGSTAYPYLPVDSSRLRMLPTLAELLGLADLRTKGIAQRESMANAFPQHVISRIGGKTFQLAAIVLQVLQTPGLDIPFDQVD